MSGLTINGTSIKEIIETSDTILLEARQVERHLHSVKRYLCAAVIPDGTVHVADKISSVVAPNTATGFTVISGNNDWGNWVQILGSSDTPILNSMLSFDLLDIFITNSSTINTLYLLQISFGNTTPGDAVTAENYTEILHATQTTAIGAIRAVLPCNSRRVDIGTKMWARCFTPGFNARSVIFFFGLHEHLEVAIQE